MSTSNTPSFSLHAQMTGRCPAGRLRIWRSSMNMHPDRPLDEKAHGDCRQTSVKEIGGGKAQTS